MPEQMLNQDVAEPDLIPILPEEVVADTLSEPEDLQEDVNIEELNKPIEVLFKNYAKNKKIVEEVKKKIRVGFEAVRYRDDLETIWDNNDKMFRCQPLDESQKENRANCGTGEFHVAINQLQSMAYKVITENPNSYKFEADDTTVSEEGFSDILRNNANILNKLLQRAFSEMLFKKQLRRLLHDFYKCSNACGVVQWHKKTTTCPYKNKETELLEYQDVLEFSLPMLFHERIDQVWLDSNLDDITDQPYVFIRSPITWSDLLEDEEDEKIVLPDFKNNDSNKNRDTFKETISSEYETSKTSAMDNSNREYSEKSREVYKHWYCYIRLPISNETKNGKWDEFGKETLFRVRLLGDPCNCEILEIIESPLPGGMPVLWTSQTADSIGMYSISLGEKCKTFYEQLCTAHNQEIDNRGKNVRRPVVYDAARGDAMRGYDFGHSNLIPVEGNPREIFAEMQISDMTGSIQNSKQELAYKIKEITNTTEAVTGQAMGGRTSASEYMGAKIAATTPIFADMAQFEADIIVEYMRKFAAAVTAYMTHKDIVDMIGKEGETFNFSASARYKVIARGVVDAMETSNLINNLMMLLSQTQDANVRSNILLRTAEAMKLDNPQELVPKLAKDQAIKAALFENNEMLVYGKQERPESGEPHDIHLAIHREARWTASKEGNQNVWIIDQHIAETENLKKQDQVANVSQPLPVNGQQAGESQLPGLKSGQDISADIGAQGGGSQMPMY